MSEQNPFEVFGTPGEKTVIKPSAGRTGRASPPAQPSHADHSAVGEFSLDGLMQASLNPLVAAAAPLLVTAVRIAAMSHHPDPRALRQALADGVRKFERETRSRGLSNQQVLGGRYIVCTLLDEAVANTPWGASCGWSDQTLLVEFHNEAVGGDTVFMVMSKLAENVDANRDLLELVYVTLAFGFKGRYSQSSGGLAQLDATREKLAQMLTGGRRRYDKELAPHWRGAATRASRVGDSIPVWVVASVSALALGLIFSASRIALNISTDGVATQLSGLDVKSASLPLPAVAPSVPEQITKPRLRTFLEREIAARQVAVLDRADRSIITIQGDDMFPVGSADVADRVRPLLGRIGEALRQTPGQVLIAGHTDSQPIRSLRFPSNFHLSQARAETVLELLQAHVPAQRMRAVGRGDSEPVDRANTPTAHAKNRRVEITLMAAS